MINIKFWVYLQGEGKFVQMNEMKQMVIDLRVCKWNPNYLLHQIPIHEPVVINLNDDSSDEEEYPHHKSSAIPASSLQGSSNTNSGPKPLQSRSSASSFLSGLDSFLKEARLSSGVRFCVLFVEELVL